MTYDEWLEAPYMRQDPDPAEILADDEGAHILEDAASYLRASYRDDDGADLAGDEIKECLRLIERDYECGYCGTWSGKKRSYCNKRCYEAAMQ
jgi:hypothetical protein